MGRRTNREIFESGLQPKLRREGSLFKISVNGPGNPRVLKSHAGVIKGAVSHAAKMLATWTLLGSTATILVWV